MPPVACHDLGRELKVEGVNFELVLDKVCGVISLGPMKEVHGRQRAKLNFWHAPTDNDRNSTEDWKKTGLKHLTHRVDQVRGN